jgi:hypothetical protein
MDGMLPHPADPIERAAWTSELVYGTLTVLIAIAGVEVAGGASPTGAGAIVLVGAVATWLAHAYATLLGRRAALGHQASVAQVGHALRHTWPIVLAAIPSVIAIGGASLGWWSSGVALGFSNAAGIAVLAGAGWMAARAASANLGGQLRSTIVTASIGLGIVAVELLLHR